MKTFIQEDGDVDGEPFALELGQIAERLVSLGCAQGLIPPVFHDDAWRRWADGGHKLVERWLSYE